MSNRLIIYHTLPFPLDGAVNVKSIPSVESVIQESEYGIESVNTLGAPGSKTKPAILEVVLVPEHETFSGQFSALMDQFGPILSAMGGGSSVEDKDFVFYSNAQVFCQDDRTTDGAQDQEENAPKQDPIHEEVIQEDGEAAPVIPDEEIDLSMLSRKQRRELLNKPPKKD